MADTQEQASPRGRWRILPLILLFGALAVMLLWSQRRPVATHLIDRHFAASGVAARYTLVDLGPRLAVLRDLRIGDPARPDLTVPEVMVRFGWGVTGPRLATLDVRGARLRARFVNGRLSLGAIDRLLPAPSGKAFALPQWRLALADSSIQVATPAGLIGVAAAGNGYLPSGFRGRIAVSAPQLRHRDCGGAARGRAEIKTVDRRIDLAGTLTTAAFRCAGMMVTGSKADFTLSLPESVDRWRGDALALLTGLRGNGVQTPRGVAAVHFAGGAANTAGIAAIRAIAPRYRSGEARLARVDGGFAFGRDAQWFDGRLGLVAASVLAQLPPAPLPAGTPVSPLAARASQAVNRALRRFDGGAELRIEPSQNWHILLRSASAVAASGGEIKLAGPITIGRDGIAGDGKLLMRGGGLPALALSLRAAKGRLSLTAEGNGYAAAGAEIEPFELRYAETGDTGRLNGTLTVSGPLADGRVERLQLPLDLRVDRRQGLAVIAETCQPLRFAGLTLAGTTMGRTSLSLCSGPGATLFRSSASGLSGGVRLSKPSLRGRMGGNGLDVSAGAVELDWSGSKARPCARLAVDRLGLRLSDGTSLVLDRLSGNLDLADGFRAEGLINGFSGRLANVPLLVDQGAGRWHFANGALVLDGAAARVSDAVSPARFLPIRVDAVALSYASGRLTGKGALASFVERRSIGSLRLAHDFATATASGEARVVVPGLRFGEDFQPEQLTPLTRGVVADVRGAISGEGTVRWNGKGVTSDGRFGTDGLDLAAAFGPVRGLSGTLHFDDLLALATPPGQEATVAEINPGVSVAGGRIRFQLLPGQRVAVEEGRWPFAGGTLILEPSLLDFGKVSARRFTLKVDGLDAAAFLQQLEFKNFSATGLFDGRLPLIFEGDTGRIEGGRLVARPPGGLIAYVGEVGGDKLGAAGQFAFDALKRLRYTQLAIALDGELAGEIVSRVDFNGVNEVPVSPAGGGIPVRATGLPFRFNVTVRAPFRGLMNAATSFGDARSVIGQSLRVQPAASAPVPASPPR